MPDFKGSKNIELQPLCKNVSYEFEISVAPEGKPNQGFIPYGSEIDSTASIATIKIFDNKGVDKTSEILKDIDLTGFKVTLILTYPTTSGEGYYGIRFVIILVDGQEIEADFARIEAVNKGFG